MKLPFYTSDVFTTTRFTGNPAAIVILPPSSTPNTLQLTQAEKQSIATEFNVSETVFLHPPTPDEPDIAPIDIFTTKAQQRAETHGWNPRLSPRGMVTHPAIRHAKP